MLGLVVLQLTKNLHYVYSEEYFANLIGEQLSIESRDYIVNMIRTLEKQEEIGKLENKLEDCEELIHEIDRLENDIYDRDNRIEKIESELNKLKTRKLKQKRG